MGGSPASSGGRFSLPSVVAANVTSFVRVDTTHVALTFDRAIVTPPTIVSGVVAGPRSGTGVGAVSGSTVTVTMSGSVPISGSWSLTPGGFDAVFTGGASAAPGAGSY